MRFEEIMREMCESKQIVNNNWNGLKLDGKIMYVTLQFPDENSLNTEPYFMFHSGIFKEGGWVFKRFPWTPSTLDLLSGDWEVRKEEERNDK